MLEVRLPSPWVGSLFHHMGLPGTELRPPCLAAWDFIHWAVSPAHNSWQTFGTWLLFIISHSVCSWEYWLQNAGDFTHMCAHPFPPVTHISAVILPPWWTMFNRWLDVHMNTCRGGCTHRSLWEPFTLTTTHLRSTYVSRSSQRAGHKLLQSDKLKGRLQKRHLLSVRLSPTMWKLMAWDQLSPSIICNPGLHFPHFYHAPVGVIDLITYVYIFVGCYISLQSLFHMNESCKLYSSAEAAPAFSPFYDYFWNIPSSKLSIIIVKEEALGG